MHRLKTTFLRISWFIGLVALICTIIIPITVSAAVIDEDDLEPEQKPGVFEKQLSKFALNVANSLISLSGAQDVSVLVFQRKDVIQEDESWIQNTTSADRENMVFGIFPNALFEGVAAIYDMFVGLLPIPILVILVGAALFLVFDIMRSTDTRSSMKEHILGVIFAVVLIRFGHLLWDWIIFINNFIVDAVYIVLSNNGIHVTSFLATIWDPTSTDKVTSSPSFMVAIIVLLAAFTTFSINYQYMVRMLTLGMLIVLFPAVILAVVMPSRRNVLNLWFSIFVSQVFTQAAHAISLGLFFFLLKNADQLAFWLVFAMFFALPMLSDLVQRIVSAFTGEGFGGGLKTSLSNASGITGLMAIATLSKGVLSSSKNQSNKSTSVKEGNHSSMTNSSSMANTSSNNASNTSSSMNNGIMQGGTNTSVSTHNTSGLNTTGTGVPIQSSINNADLNGQPVNHNTFNSAAPVSNGMNATENGNKNDRITTTKDNLQNKENGTNTSSSKKFAQKGGQIIAGTGHKVANSELLKKGAKVATIASLATAGYAISTMTTGRGNNGVTAAGLAGVAMSPLVSSAVEKTGKGLEVGGEVIQSKSEGSSALHRTKERLGFHDPAQLADSKEMARMSKELIGGKTAEIIGATIGKANYNAGKYGISGPNKNFNAKEAFETVSKKNELTNVSLPQQDMHVNNAKKNLDIAKSGVQVAKAEHLLNPTTDNKLNIENARKKQAATTISYEKENEKNEVMKMQALNYYQLQKEAKEMQKLNTQRRSNGAI